MGNLHFLCYHNYYCHLFRQIYPGSNHSTENCQSKTTRVDNLAANVDIKVLQAAIKKLEGKTAGPAGDGASTSAAADDKKKKVLSHKEADIIQHDSHMTDAQMDTWLMHYRYVYFIYSLHVALFS